MDEKLKEKFVQYQQIQEQLKQFRAFFEELSNKGTEITGIIEALDEIKDTKKGKKLLVPIASGIFLSTELIDPNQVIVNVGSEVCVNRSVDDTKSMLQKRLADVEKQAGEVETIITQLTTVEMELEAELEKHV